MPTTSRLVGEEALFALFGRLLDRISKLMLAAMIGADLWILCSGPSAVDTKVDTKRIRASTTEHVRDMLD